MKRVRRLGRWSMLASVGVLLAACAKGDTGLTGAPGSQGPPGPAGPAGSTHPLDTLLHLSEDMPGVNLTIVALSGASGPTFLPGDTVSVTFRVETDNGTPIALNELDSARMWLAGPTTLYQKITGNFSDVATASVANADGSWTYTLADPIPATYPLQYYETGAFPENEGLSGQALLSGTYTLCFRAYKYYWDTNGTRFRDVGNVVQDFLLGSATVLEPRTVVSDAACNACHGTIQMHGGSYRTVKMCVTCHTTGAESELDPVEAPKKEILDFRVLIHKLHNAKHLPSVNGVTVDASGNKDYTSMPPQTYMIGGHDFVEEVHFPVFPTGMPRDVGYDSLTPDEQDQEDEILDGITACAKCHVDPDGSGPLTLADNNAFTKPSRRACGSCHDDIKWGQTYISNLSSGMPSQADDASCLGCHPSTSVLGVENAHRHPIHDSTLNPGVVITITAVGEDPTDPNADMDGTIDVGEKLQVTLNIRDDSGADIDPATIGRWEILVGGPTENPQLFQRKYMPKDILGATASSYTLNVPEFWNLNLVGTYPGAGGPFPSSTLRAPFHTNVSDPSWVTAPGIEVYEVDLLGVGPGAGDSLAVATVVGQNYLEVTSAANFAVDDYIVVARGTPNEEYYKIYAINGNRLSLGRLDSGNSSNDFRAADLEFAPWVRLVHAAGVAVEPVPVALRALGTDYTVDEANGQISTAAPGSSNWLAVGNPILVSAITDFVMPATYRNGYTNFNVTDGSMGAWIGLPILDGTYGVKAGVSTTFTVVPPRTLGTGVDETSYNEPSVVSDGGAFLVGSATELGTYPPIILSSMTNCDDCHAVPGQRMVFHGRRAGAEYCLNCHGTAQFGGGSPIAGRRFFRRMIHGYHMGRNLTFASVFENGAAADIGFPMFPGGPKHCEKCHGNDSYEQPIERDHPDQVVPYKKYATPCLGCHDSTGAQAHADLNTAPSGYESCVACHDPGSIYNVELVHKNR